jgi:cobalt/nickel transport system permease protein
MQAFTHLLKPVFMHVPDGLLSLPVAILCWIISAALVWVAVRRTKGDLGERQVPLMGVMAAFIFAAQMINFPVAGGTSGHLLGGALAAITLGPWAAMLVMTSVIMVQALLFQDGGLVVMGANILNMGLLTVLVSYGLYRATANHSRKARLGVAGLAAWLSVMAAALATSLQLWLSGTARLDFVVPAMLSVHALIGIGEALITVAALGFILRARPAMLEAPASGAGRGKGWVVVGLLLSLGVVALAPLASASPDGFERVAEDLGFLHLGQEAPFNLLPDYSLPFLGETPLSTILSGVLGVLGVAALVILLMRSLRRATPEYQTETKTRIS